MEDEHSTHQLGKGTCLVKMVLRPEYAKAVGKSLKGTKLRREFEARLPALPSGVMRMASIPEHGDIPDFANLNMNIGWWGV